MDSMSQKDDRHRPRGRTRFGSRTSVGLSGPGGSTSKDGGAGTVQALSGLITDARGGTVGGSCRRGGGCGPQRWCRRRRRCGIGFAAPAILRARLWPVLAVAGRCELEPVTLHAPGFAAVHTLADEARQSVDAVRNKHGASWPDRGANRSSPAAIDAKSGDRDSAGAVGSLTALAVTKLGPSTLILLAYEAVRKCLL